MHISISFRTKRERIKTERSKILKVIKPSCMSENILHIYITLRNSQVSNFNNGLSNNRVKNIYKPQAEACTKNVSWEFWGIFRDLN